MAGPEAGALTRPSISGDLISPGRPTCGGKPVTPIYSVRSLNISTSPHMCLKRWGRARGGDERKQCCRAGGPEGAGRGLRPQAHHARRGHAPTDPYDRLDSRTSKGGRFWGKVGGVAGATGWLGGRLVTRAAAGGATGDPAQLCKIPPTRFAGGWGGTMRDTNPGRPAGIGPGRPGGRGGACAAGRQRAPRASTPGGLG